MEYLVSFTPITFFIFLCLVTCGFMIIIWYYSCKSTKLLKIIKDLKSENKILTAKNKSLQKNIDELLYKKKNFLDNLIQQIKKFLEKEVFKKL